MNFIGKDICARPLIKPMARVAKDSSFNKRKENLLTVSAFKKQLKKIYKRG